MMFKKITLALMMILMVGCQKENNATKTETPSDNKPTALQTTMIGSLSTLSIDESYRVISVKGNDIYLQRVKLICENCPYATSGIQKYNSETDVLTDLITFEDSKMMINFIVDDNNNVYLEYVDGVSDTGINNMDINIVQLIDGEMKTIATYSGDTVKTLFKAGNQIYLEEQLFNDQYRMVKINYYALSDLSTPVFTYDLKDMNIESGNFWFGYKDYTTNKSLFITYNSSFNSLILDDSELVRKNILVGKDLIRQDSQDAVTTISLLDNATQDLKELFKFNNKNIFIEIHNVVLAINNENLVLRPDLTSVQLFNNASGEVTDIEDLTEEQITMLAFSNSYHRGLLSVKYDGTNIVLHSFELEGAKITHTEYILSDSKDVISKFNNIQNMQYSVQSDRNGNSVLTLFEYGTLKEELYTVSFILK